MGFSYNPGTDATETDYIRFTIKDTQEDVNGPQPEDKSFSDEELEMMLEAEGSWQRAVAACYEALESAWAKHVTVQADGATISYSHVALRYKDLAERQRKRFGGGKGATARVIATTRVDGFSQDIASNVVDDVAY